MFSPGSMFATTSTLVTTSIARTATAIDRSSSIRGRRPGAAPSGAGPSSAGSVGSARTALQGPVRPSPAALADDDTALLPPRRGSGGHPPGVMQATGRALNRPILGRKNGEGHGPEIPHTAGAACQGPDRPTIRRAARSALPRRQARKADVTPDGVVPDSANPDVVLVGGGIMSATLAALLGVVAPQWTVTVFESAADVAGESSDAWNNAGTGHAALCELNYTPAGPDGRVDPAKAVTINEQFQVSRQFWSHLVREGMTGSPKDFITPVPHLSFVTGEAGRAYMRARHEALAAQPLFAGLEYTDDPAALAEWVPLMMEGRDPREVVAATRSVAGTDVNFGSLTRLLLDDAAARGVTVHCNQRVT